MKGLTATSHKEARELAEAFSGLIKEEAWQRLKRFVAFMQLNAGQRALAKPEEVNHWKSWSEGVGFILRVVEDAIDEVEQYEAEFEDQEKDTLEFLDFGGGDPL